MRTLFLMTALVFMGLTSAGSNAQVPYTWCGWNFYPYYWNGEGTVQGSILRGMGAYLQGAGNYNLMTAEANAINTNTWITWNEYVSAVTANMAKRYAERQKAERNHRLKLRNERYIQLRDLPTEYDVRQGDAINLKIALLTGGGYASAVFDEAAVPLTAAFIAQLPIRKASEGLGVALSDLSEKIKWPSSLVETTPEKSRKEVEQALADAYSDLQDGTVAMHSVTRLKKAVAQLEAAVSPTDINGKHAVSKLKNAVRVVASADFSAALAQVVALGDTTIGGLLRVMSDNRLSFGVAETPVQRDSYDRLYLAIRSVPTLLDATTLETMAEYMAAYRY